MGKTPEPINYMGLKEFVDGGFLQEANRQFFHPLGLALEVCIDNDTVKIWDYRNDLEGIIFSDLNSEESLRKANNVTKEFYKHAITRLNKFSSVIQPIPNLIQIQGSSE